MTKKGKLPDLTNDQRRKVVEMYLGENKGISTIVRELRVSRDKVEKLLKEKQILRSRKEGVRKYHKRRAKNGEEKIL